MTIETPSQHVACALNRINLCLTHISAVRFGQRYFLWPRLGVNSVTSLFAVSHCNPPLHAHSMLYTAHLSSIEMTQLSSLPVATQPRSCMQDCPSAFGTY